MQQIASEGASADETAPHGLRAVRCLRAIIVFAVVAVGVFGADQALKYYAFASYSFTTFIPQTSSRIILPHVLAMKLTLNSGAVFGIGQGDRWLFVVVSIIAAAIIITLFLRSRARAWVLHVGLALILAGALGNLYDRIRFAVVRDMLVLFPGVNLPFGWHWPGGMTQLYPWIFNLADVALLTGVVLVLLREWLRSDGKKDPN